MPHAPFAARVTNFLRDANNGLDSPAPLGVDSELNALMNVVNQLCLRQRAVTNADGTLTNVAAATAQALAGTQDITATASQTAFLTTVTWSAAFTALNVFVYVNSVKLPTASVLGVADNGGFLEVTLAAQTVGTIITIAAFESGAGLLTRLQTVSVSDGASLIAIYDAGGYFVAVTVEAALQEEALARTTLATAVGNTADLIRRTGTVAFTANQSMGGFRLTNVGDGVGAQDAVTMNQFAAYTSVWNALQTYFLRLDGTTPMAAPLPMGANKITGLAAGTVATDAVNYSQLITYLPLAGGTMTGPINMGAQQITNLAAGVAATDAVNLSQAQGLAASFSSLSAYQAAGTNSFVVPAGLTKIRVEVFGGGGGGGLRTTSGGGGGGYATAVLTVTGGETLTVDVGAGGASGGAPTAGGLSKISRVATALVTSNGGNPGDAVGIANGGTVAFDGSVAGFGINGGYGQHGDYIDHASGRWFAGLGGDCPRGGAGGIGYSTSDGSSGGTYTNGVAPGGGGGCGDSGGAGSGAAGAILIWY
jgi:hypothetical protein